jgi:hypothetical protein
LELLIYVSSGNSPSRFARVLPDLRDLRTRSTWLLDLNTRPGYSTSLIPRSMENSDSHDLKVVRMSDSYDLKVVRLPIPPDLLVGRISDSLDLLVGRISDSLDLLVGRISDSHDLQVGMFSVSNDLFRSELRSRIHEFVFLSL